MLTDMTTPLRSHAVTQSRSYAVTQLRSHAVTQSRSYAVTQSRSHAVTQSRSHAVTQSRSHCCLSVFIRPHDDGFVIVLLCLENRRQHPHPLWRSVPPHCLSVNYTDHFLAINAATRSGGTTYERNRRPRTSDSTFLKGSPLSIAPIRSCAINL